MEPFFENVTVETEEMLQKTYNNLRSKIYIYEFVICGLVLVLSAGMYILQRSETWLLLMVAYIGFLIYRLCQYANYGKNSMRKRLAYYDGANPPMNHRFYADHVVAQDVDSMNMTPYCKLRKVEYNGELLRSLSNIIRTRLGGCLIVPGILLFIDGRQPICFRKVFLSQPSNPRRSEISEVWGRTKARRRFADGLCALQTAATQHWGVPTPQKRVRIMLLRLRTAQSSTWMPGASLRVTVNPAISSSKIKFISTCPLPSGNYPNQEAFPR